MKPNDWWVDPRENTKPPYRGLERPLATSRTDLAQLLDACRAGRIYDVELWIKSGRPLQLTSECTNQGRARSQSALAISIDAGFLDLTRLLLCNGFRTELEIESPLNAALETRKWNLCSSPFGMGIRPERC
jgi:hypothetical protein